MHTTQTHLKSDELLSHLRRDDSIRTRLQNFRLLRQPMREKPHARGVRVKAHQLRAVSPRGAHDERHAVARIELMTTEHISEGLRGRRVGAHLCIGVHC